MRTAWRALAIAALAAAAQACAAREESGEAAQARGSSAPEGEGAGSAGPAAASRAWTEALDERLEALDRETAGELGVYVKRLDTGEVVEHEAGRAYYLSSTIKVPVAIVVLRQVEAGTLRMDQVLEVRDTDRVDGAGDLQSRPAGTKVTVAQLLEKMLVNSDSTATDMLIRLAGEPSLNAFLAENGFGPATTLIQVRRDAYGELHPNAAKLTNADYMAIKGAGGLAARRAAFAARAGVAESDLRAATLEDAFERYYRRGVNAATLQAFGRLLERLARGELLSDEHSALVLRHMQAITTGDRRILAGLPRGTDFAQKTGTQVARVCNVGIIEPDEPHAIVVAACVEKFTDQGAAEGVLRRVGEAIATSGAL